MVNMINYLNNIWNTIPNASLQHKRIFSFLLYSVLLLLFYECYFKISLYIHYATIFYWEINDSRNDLNELWKISFFLHI